MRKHFFSGLVIFISISLTLWLTIHFFGFFYLKTSQLFLPLLKVWLPLPQGFVRFFSFLLALLLIWAMGWATSHAVGRRVLSAVEFMIQRIPLFRSLYIAIQKITDAFFGTNPLYQSVVLVEYPREGVYTFGFVTSRVPGKIFNSQETHLCVFVPTVPNPTSGLLLYVPQSATIPLSLSMEEAAKILVSHGFVPIPDSAAPDPER